MIVCCEGAEAVAIGLARLEVPAGLLGHGSEGGLSPRLEAEGVSIHPRLPKDVAGLHVGASGTEPPDRIGDRVLVSVDLGEPLEPSGTADRLDRLLAAAGLVRASRRDLERIAPGSRPEAVASAWLGGGAGLVVVSLGPDGALAVGGAGEARVPAHPTDVVDTAGAGDAFTAGLLAWLFHRALCDPRAVAHLDGHDLVDALGFACLVAGLSCRRTGFSPPTFDEVRARL